METQSLIQDFSGELLIPLAYFFIIVSTLLGVTMHLKLMWRFRLLMIVVLVLLIGISLGFLLVSDENIVILLAVILLQSYRLFGLLRIVKNRVENGHLRNRSLRTELFFSISLLFLVIIAQLDVYNVLVIEEWVLVLSAAQIILALVYWNHIKESSRLTNITTPRHRLTDTELPSISVAIPARNETEELSSSLTALLDNDYPKLEIIVLDDCSQDRTSEIIKDFAHRGVRFIPGKSPSGSWLAKNFAYSQLLEESNGKYIIFCGSDVRFGASAIRDLVETAIQNDIDMVSILPVRFSQPFDKNFLLQPMRYWREMVIPKITDKSPPVLSTCWLINRNVLLKLGGFAAYKKAIRPEKFFARSVKQNGRYRFIRATSGYQISSVKNLSAQWNTAIRTRYPELRNQPEKIFISTMSTGLLILLSPVVLVLSVLSGLFLASVFSASSTLIFIIIYLSVNRLTNPKVRITRAFMFPLSVILEIVINNYSMWAYEFSTVNWKGRNICIPVLQNIPKFPKTNQSL